MGVLRLSAREDAVIPALREFISHCRQHKFNLILFSMSLSRIPSLNWLRVFEAAARTQSFVRAAELLHMSPPAVSQQIKSLETYLGRELFERGAHSVRLTTAGEAFLPSVQQALLSVETAAAGLFGTRAETTIHVQATLVLAVGWLASRLAAFHDSNPGIRVRLTTANLNADFLREEPDVRIVYGHLNLPGPAPERLLAEALVPVAAPALAGQIGKPQDLLAHPLIEVETHRSGWLQVFAELGLNPDAPPRFEFTDSTVMALALAAAGQAVALARVPAAYDLARLHGLVPCLPDLDPVVAVDHYWLHMPASSSRAISRFREWLKEQASKPAG
jgi:LysR family glycine cleavage system transcriptional activator